MCLCLCAGERAVSVSMAPSLSKARELHHVSVRVPHVCVIVSVESTGLSMPLHVRGVCEHAVCACAGASDTVPSFHGTSQILLRPLWTTCPSPTLQAPSRITSRLDRIGQALGIPFSLSAGGREGSRRATHSPALAHLMHGGLCAFLFQRRSESL